MSARVTGADFSQQPQNTLSIIVKKFSFGSARLQKESTNKSQSVPSTVTENGFKRMGPVWDIDSSDGTVQYRVPGRKCTINLDRPFQLVSDVAYWARSELGK